MTFYKKPSLLFFGLVIMYCFAIPKTFAGFEVMEQDDHEFFGNAKNENFRRAVDNEDPLDATDRSFLAHMNNAKNENRSFWKFSVARVSMELDKIKLTTTPTTTTTTIPTKSDDLFELNLGFGHRWVSWELELELLIRERILLTHTQPAVAPLSAYTVTADIQPFTLFANITYEIPRIFTFIPSRIHPYIQAGGGINYNVSTTTATAIGGLIPFYTRKTGGNSRYVWNAGLGVKIDITGQLMANFVYRYVDLKDAKIGPISDTTGAIIPVTHTTSIKAHDFTSEGFYFGILYFS